MSTTYLQPKLRDTLIIPDKYNTGTNPIADESVRGTLTEVTTAGTYGGVVFSLYNEDPFLAIRWNNATNNALGSHVVVENYDFSHFELLASALESSAPSVHLIEFKNCILPKEVRSGQQDYNISYKFTNCEFGQITGSHFETSKCNIGHTPNDGIDPLKSVIVKDTLISDLCHFTEAYTHTDGIQISGTTGIDANNILISNTRIEVPMLKITGNNLGMAGCLFFDVENANSDNVVVENCLVNGAGYSITIVTENDFDISNYSLSDIGIGTSYIYNRLGTIDSRATLTNVGTTEKLYIGSVWKDIDNHTHISITNDTNIAKTVLVYSNLGMQEIAIPKCPSYSELIIDVDTFDSLPFDIDTDIGIVDWFVAYDTLSTEANQIRFVNYTENQIVSPIQNTLNIFNPFLIKKSFLMYLIKNKTPSYTPLAWLQSDGTQIIDTGILASNDLIIKTNLRLSGALTGGVFGGSGTSASTSQGRFTLTKTTSGYGGSNTAMSPVLVNDTDYTVEKNGGVTTVNGAVVSTTTESTFISVNPVGIFGAYSGLTYKASKTYNIWRMYGTSDVYFQIIKKSTSEILRDFIPALDGLSVPCLYDKVSNALFYKEVGNDFIYSL